MRQRPWKMEGLGKSHFPITTKAPEVQAWFDQGLVCLQNRFCGLSTEATQVAPTGRMPPRSHALMTV